MLACDVDEDGLAATAAEAGGARVVAMRADVSRAEDVDAVAELQPDDGVLESAAKAAGPHGVRVNAVAPGPIATRMVDALAAGLAPDDATRRGGPRAPHRDDPDRPLRGARGGRAGDRVLCSPESSYVNGAVWTVDGGQVA